jgi:single-strand DNA-binding protein
MFGELVSGATSPSPWCLNTDVRGNTVNQHSNEVHLVGRLGGTVEERELPSGTMITNFSVIVDRPAKEIYGRTKVDTIACQTTRSAVVSRISKSEAGATIEVIGALRRRFWRAGSALASATEVDVTRVRIL